MLVISRKLNESVLLGDEIEIRVLRAKRDSVRLGIAAPTQIPVVRGELLEEVKRQNKAALALDPDELLGRRKKSRARNRVTVPSLDSPKLLASWLTHEVRNYLTPIHGELQLALMDCDQGPMCQEVVAAEAQVRTLAGWLKEADLIGRSVLFQSDRCELQTLIRNELESCNSKLGFSVSGQTGIEFPVTFPSLGSPLIQLLNNAQEAGASRAAIQVERYKEGVRITVEDDGCGIDRCTLENLGQPLFSTKPRQIGIGLAVARNWVDAFGGEVVVESSLGSGTKTTLLLPRLSPPAKRPSEPRVILKAGFDCKEQRALQKAGYRVLLAEDEEQLGILRQRFPDLRVIDPELHEGSGDTATRTMVSARRNERP